MEGKLNVMIIKGYSMKLWPYKRDDLLKGLPLGQDGQVILYIRRKLNWPYTILSRMDGSTPYPITTLHTR